MGRGLSPQQREILGMGYTVNKFTQGGEVKAKGDAPAVGHMGERWSCPTSNYQQAKDVELYLAIYAVGKIVPDRDLTDWKTCTPYTPSPRYNCIRASISRAIQRLRQRSLIILAPVSSTTRCDFTSDYGYVLTAEGLEVGAQHELEIPALSDALGFFGVHWPVNVWSINRDERDDLKERQFLALQRIRGER
jgi:hypothetical protein